MADGNGTNRIALVQMTSTENKEANFQQAKSLILRAVMKRAQMIFLPECFDYVGSSQAGTIEGAETISGPTVEKYQELAKFHQVWLSLGGFHEKTDDPEDKKFYNTHVIIDSEGEIKGRYNKVHLFDLDIKGSVRLQETSFAHPGKSIGPPVETPCGKIGMAICYDVRFPEISISLTQQGADILTFPSAFTVPTGQAHWETLLRCRAIENQCYVLAAAQVGRHNEKRESYGHTMAVDPWGKVLVDIADKPDVQVVDIDLSYLAKRRREMPVWSHRRPDIYGTVLTTNFAPLDSQPEYQFGQVRVLSSQLFYRSALTMAFVNRKPVVPGHVLITPIRCVARFSELTSAEVADLFQVSQKVSAILEKHHGASSVTIGIQDGPDAGQTIQHVHVHVLPRKPGDFERNDDVYQRLDGHDNQEWRNDGDMAAEAAILRPYFIGTA